MRLGGGNLPLTNNFSGTNQTRVFSSAYFALDITNPESPPQLLWEYWDLVDSSSTNLGFTTSYPTVVRVGGDYSQVGNWYVIFGSGSGTLPPNLSTDTVQGTVLSNGGMGATTTHWVYILNLYTGAPVRKVDMSAVDASLSGNNAFMADPIGVDLALNYQVDEAYIGASYYNNNSSWFGKMYRINVHEDPIPNDWTFSTFMSFDKPVTAAPSAAVDTYNRLWIYVGTGRYFNATDQSDTSTQYLVGAWDSGSDTITFPTPSNLNDVTNIHVYQNGDVYNGSSYINDFGDYLTNIRSEYNAGTEYGWYLNTSAGERSLDAPTIIGGIVLFPTFIPTTNVCGTGGTSNLYALYYETGTAYYSGEYGFTPVLPCSTGCHAPTSITVGNKTYPELLKQVSLGFGMPSSAVIHSGQEQGATGFVQLGSGQIMRLPFNPAFSLHNQTLFWEERR
jgi:type IV pilus assembly protein PilY1